MSSFQQTVRAGEDIMANRHYSIAMAALFMYDYLLTLSDEVQYAWNGRKTWTFYLFLVNRYLPFISLAWGIVIQSIIAAEVFSTRPWCRESTIVKFLSVVASTLIAQVFIGTRAYALSRFNRKLLVTLSLIGVVYLLLATLLLHNIITSGGPPPDAHLETLRQCVNNPGQTLGFSCLTAVLVFDTVAIVSIVYHVVRLTRETLTLGRILHTIFRDVTIYFFVIFLSHLWLVILVKTARPEQKILPAFGLEAMIPIMISRFTLALKKAAGKDPTGNGGIFTTGPFVARAPTSPNTRGDTIQRSTSLEVT